MVNPASTSSNCPLCNSVVIVFFMNIQSPTSPCVCCVVGKIWKVRTFSPLVPASLCSLPSHRATPFPPPPSSLEMKGRLFINPRFFLVFLRTRLTSSFIAQVRFQSKEHKSPRTPKIPGNVLDPPLLSRMHRLVTWPDRTHLISQKSLQEHSHLKSFSVLEVLQDRSRKDAWQERSSQERKYVLSVLRINKQPLSRNKPNRR